MSFFLLALPYFARAQEQLVPCTNTLKTYSDGSGEVSNPCGVCEIFTLVKRVLDFIYYYVATPVAAIMLLYGGFLMATAALWGADPTKGKKVLANALIGVLITFFAWLAIDTIIKLVANQSLTSDTPAVLFPAGEVSDDFGIDTSKYGPWNEVKCKATAPVIFLAPPKPSSLSLPIGSVTDQGVSITSDVAQNKINAQTLADEKVQFSADASCGGASAATNFEELRTGQPITICFRGCTPSSTCKPDGRTATVKLLSDLVLLYARGLRFGVSSISTGNHASASAHYVGKAVDITPRGSTSFLDLRYAMINLNPSSPYIECEASGGGKIANCGSGTSHVHVTYP